MGNFSLIKQNSFIDNLQKKFSSHTSNLAFSSPFTNLTYAQLGGYSKNVASHLFLQNIHQSKIVGVCVSSSDLHLISMLGVLQIGACYVPFDAKHSKNLLNYMADDSSPDVIIVDSSTASLFSDLPFKIVFIEDLLKESGQTHLTFAICPDNTAYIIYTSGSTGVAKGIQVPYRCLNHVARAHEDIYPQNIKTLIFSGVCFDANLLAIIHTLNFKGTLLCYDTFDPSNLNGLISWIQKSKANYMITVPSVYGKLLQENQALPDLKVVSLTGENMPQALVYRHAKLMPHADLLNEYGPSEYAIGTSIAKVYDGEKQKIHPITIGRPLPETEIFILDENSQILPPLYKGEICIAGKGLALGYHNHKDLSVKKFTYIPDLNLRIYKTGDLGVKLENGEYDFLGRMKDPIHIDGSMFYLGEIEHILAKNPKLTESAAIFKDEILTIFYSRSELPFNENDFTLEIKAATQNSIPIKLKPLSQFPLTPNGKICRDQLQMMAGT